MNIYKLITPVNKYNYVNHPYIKRDLDYYSQHYSDNNTNTDEFAFMKRKKLSTTIYGSNYNDDYLTPKINVISNAMKVNIEDRTPLSKRVPEVMQNPYIPFGDPNTKYDELLTASPTMLASVEPVNYFGCRIVNDYLYNFDIGMIFKIIPTDFLARFVDPTLIKENTVYVDSRSAMIMSNKSAFKNIWMDTKRYIPINPKYVETIDIISLIEQSEQNKFHQSQQPVEPVREPVIEPVREPVEPVRQPVEPVSTVQQPVEPVSTVQQPVSTVQQPVEPVRQPVEPVRQPVEQPVSTVQQPIEPVSTVQQPIEPVSTDYTTVRKPVRQIVEQPDKISMNKPSRAYRRSNKKKQSENDKI